MAITRRQFVGRLGAVAAAAGISQGQLAKLVEAWGLAGSGTFGGNGKPKVVWVHGAECTGCSTSLLSLFEDVTGTAVPGHGTLGDISTAQALDFIGDGEYEITGYTAAAHLADMQNAVIDIVLAGARTLDTWGAFGTYGLGNAPDPAAAATIADVLLDFIDLEYHETVMGQFGDVAYNYINQLMAGNLPDGTANTRPYVLVVEGAVQDSSAGNDGYWGNQGYTIGSDHPWCSIGIDGTDGGTAELKFDEVVNALGSNVNCLAIVAIGQCATFGGYPGSVPLGLAEAESMTGAKGVYDFFESVKGDHITKLKVVNVPGCPTNPWWFVLTVVAYLVDLTWVLTTGTDGGLGILDTSLNIKASAVDADRRLLAVYGNLLHGKYCPRYYYYGKRKYATKPGEAGCLKNIGCKGLYTMSLCGRSGWNNQQPRNAVLGSASFVGNVGVLTGVDLADDTGVTQTVAGCADKWGSDSLGGNCIVAGHPCMGCTEKGYPDVSQFVVR